MSLRDCEVKREYRSLADDVVRKFYMPLLGEAKAYRRAVGFFSSTSLVEISKGIGDLARNGGKMQIVASPYLTDEDVDAIRRGYASRDEIIENALIRGLSDEVDDYCNMERLNLLASLIADGVLDIRIAYTEGKGGIGMYHEKMGIIEDADGNAVAFSGSMNESRTAMSVNYETIDAFCNWKGDDERYRVELKQRAFDLIWNDADPNVKVREFPRVTDELIKRYKRTSPNYYIDAEQFGREQNRGERESAEDAVENAEDTESERIAEKAAEDEPEPKARPMGARRPDSVELYDYQLEAIDEWARRGYRGVFDMATGTGKTYTGLGAIARLSEDLGDELAVIITCPFQHLVEQWLEDIRAFNIDPIVGYSGSAQRDWKQRLDKAVRDQKIRRDKKFFCFVCTNATFKNSYVQECISKIKSPILLVVDEAHNFGAISYSKYLDDRFTYRLALSATFDRYRDEEGTAFLYGFFGEKCIEYTLEMAIRDEKLTPYRYYPILVYLDEDELEEYSLLSYQMSKQLTKDRKGNVTLNSYGKILAIKRSRVVAAAKGKLDALRDAITPYTDQNNILVYCGATNVDVDSDTLDIDESEIRQIDAVSDILGNELGMNVSQFTSRESIEQRGIIKEKFKNGDFLQALVAIKCLDEGLNIPGIRTAFILASTTNPKEYIQRRGRVLRRAENKEYAEIYDFVTLPREIDTVSSLTEDQAKRDLTLVKNELARVEEFGRLSSNKIEANRVIWAVCEAYNIDIDDVASDANGGK